MATINSSPEGLYRNSYNLTWSIKSSSPLEKVRILFRKMVRIFCCHFCIDRDNTILFSRKFFFLLFRISSLQISITMARGVISWWVCPTFGELIHTIHKNGVMFAPMFEVATRYTRIYFNI